MPVIVEWCIALYNNNVLEIEGKTKTPTTLVNLINDVFGVIHELFLLTSNMKKEVLGLLEYFFSFLRKYDAK
jgi:hypothetical protein